MLNAEPVDSLRELSQLVQTFNEERDWIQFHSPKNLAMAIASEAGELLHELRWEANGEDMHEEVRARLASEIADVLIFSIGLANALELDVPTVVSEKLQHNEKRF